MSWTMAMPVLSTVHISEDTNNWLRNHAGDWSEVEFAGYSNGFFIGLGDRDTNSSEQFPNHSDLQEIKRWVHRHYPEANWVRLDADGDVADGLPKYEW